MKTTMTNHNEISNRKLKEFQFEIESWKRLLCLQMEENSLMKIQLSDILKNKYDSTWLEEIEAFQAQFISHDEHISMLRKDVADLNDSLHDDHAGRMTKPNEEKMVKMRADMMTSKNQLNILMLAFDDFQSKIYRRNGNEN